ncbi:MAG TPA: DUF2380 domain-containing protein, partial [Gemmatimonadales bacterium]|nr:DUF2380 domain-containing protein [Gemmatimonadales bacterium]
DVALLAWDIAEFARDPSWGTAAGVGLGLAALVPGVPNVNALRRAAGGAPKLLTAGKLVDHHIFPQQFRRFFQSKGIDIDQFTVRIGETTHLKGVHGRGLGNMPGGWNARWSEFIDANPGATPKDIYQFAGRLMDEFGLSGLPIAPYPR